MTMTSDVISSSSSMPVTHVAFHFIASHRIASPRLASLRVSPIPTDPFIPAFPLCRANDIIHTTYTFTSRMTHTRVHHTHSP